MKGGHDLTDRLVSLAPGVALAAGVCLALMAAPSQAHDGAGLSLSSLSPEIQNGLLDQGLLSGGTGLDAPPGDAAPAPPADGATATEPGERPLRVYVVVVDGLRPQEVGPLTPALEGLKAAGTWYEQARAVFPGETLPNHAAMATGVLPQRNGIIANQFDRGGI